MLKYLLLLLVVWLIWRIYSASRRRLARKAETAQSAPQDMVQCASCGTYLPHTKALTDNLDPGRCYCRDHAPANHSDKSL